MKLLDVTKCIGCRRGEDNFYIRKDGGVFEVYHAATPGSFPHVCGNQDVLVFLFSNAGIPIEEGEVRALPYALLKELQGRRMWWENMLKIGNHHKMSNATVASIFVNNFNQLPDVEVEQDLITEYEYSTGSRLPYGLYKKTELYTMNEDEDILAY